MSHVNFKDALVKNIFFRVILQILDKLVTTVGLIILARLLKPYDFGLIFLTQVFIGLVEMFKSEMLDSALVYEKRDDDNIYDVAFSADLMFSVLLFSVLFILAPLWGRIYASEILVSTTRLYGLLMLMQSFIIIPKTKLIKKFEFAKVSAINLLVSVVKTVLTIGLVSIGFSFWGVIYGSLIGSGFLILLFNLSQPSRMRIRIDFKIFKKLMGYVKYIFLINIASYILTEMNGIVIGKVIGIIAVGYFQIAYRWGFWVFNNIFTFMESILFPLYSKYREDGDMIRKIFIKTLRYGSLAAFPISIGLFLVASEFVNIILGNKWAFSIVPLKILCLAGLVQFLGYLSHPLLKGAGHVKLNSKKVYFNVVVLAALLFPLTRVFGITGASIAILSSAIITQSLFCFYSANVLKVRALEILKNIYVPLVGSIFMSISILLVRWLASNLGFEEAGRFIALVISGSLTYALVVALFMRHEIISEIVSSHILCRNKESK